jgi:RNA polymerase-binding transcription factor DksA
MSDLEISGLDPTTVLEPSSVASDPVTPAAAPLDLDRIEADLADVEIALARLDTGDYWRDEITGDSLPDSLLAAHPTARRRAPDTP